jgi:hypothetical protein
MARRPISRVDLTKIAERFFRTKKERTGPVVQIGPITADDIKGVEPRIADPSNYRTGSTGLMDEYIKLVLEPDSTGTAFHNLNPATRARFEQLRRIEPELFAQELQDIFSAENLDLSILNKSAAAQIYSSHRAKILGIDELVDKIGFPRIDFSFRKRI